MNGKTAKWASIIVGIALITLGYSCRSEGDPEEHGPPEKEYSGVAGASNDEDWYRVEVHYHTAGPPITDVEEVDWSAAIVRGPDLAEPSTVRAETSEQIRAYSTFVKIEHPSAATDSVMAADGNALPALGMGPGRPGLLAIRPPESGDDATAVRLYLELGYGDALGRARPRFQEPFSVLPNRYYTITKSDELYVRITPGGQCYVSTAEDREHMIDPEPFLNDEKLSANLTSAMLAHWNEWIVEADRLLNEKSPVQ